MYAHLGCAAATHQVLVRETDGQEEHAIPIGADEALTLAELKVASRFDKRRPKKGRGGGAAGAAAREDALAQGVSEEQLRGVPVLWVRLDAGQEWLADMRLALPLGMWTLMLDKVRAVVPGSVVLTSGPLPYCRSNFCTGQVCQWSCTHCVTLCSNTAWVHIASQG